MADAVHRFLVPGTLCDQRLFEPIRSHWRAHHPEVTAQVGDLHTLTEDPAAWCRAQLNELPPRFDLMGFSLGGVLGLMLLGLAAHRVRRLVLVASNPQAGTALHRQRWEAQWQHWTERGPRDLATHLYQAVTPETTRQPAVLDVLQRMAIATPESSFRAQGELNTRRPDGQLALKPWSGPLLLISGGADPWCGADKQALFLNARPDAVWKELPLSGHYLPLENPIETAELSHAFFASSLPNASTL